VTATSKSRSGASGGERSTRVSRRGHPSADSLSPERLIAGARRVLETNWRERFTVPSASLYPHQWSWDSAFISMGRAWLDEKRARVELATLFDGQWANGKVPHVVFNPTVPAGAYFPGPDFWDSMGLADSPRHLATSGITQPPARPAS